MTEREAFEAWFITNTSACIDGPAAAWAAWAAWQARAGQPVPAQEPAAAVESLKAVLCDPDGRVCINGSDGDRNVIQDALAALSRQASKQAQEPVAWRQKYGNRWVLYDGARPPDEPGKGVHSSGGEVQDLYAPPLSDTAKQDRIMELVVDVVAAALALGHCPVPRREEMRTWLNENHAALEAEVRKG